MPAKGNVGRITVLLSNEEFKHFTDYCREHGFKKSTLIARLIRELLDAEREKERLTTTEQRPRRL
jgi:hypothetical protein